jgi:hypothetical protein
MARCSHSERLVSLLYDGALDNALHREVAFQIADCPVCTRRMNVIERVQEVLYQTLDEEVAHLDFSDFWTNVERRLAAPPLSVWSRVSSRLRLWRLQWQPIFSWNGPVWATATALLIFVAVLLTRSPVLRRAGSAPSENPPVMLAVNNQAQIASLSATATVFVWNEPTSNATVIWVDGAPGGELP